MSENMILLTILGIAILGTLGLSQDALADSANLLVNPTNVYVTLADGDSVSPSTALTIDPFDPIFTGELISVSVSGDGCDGLQFTYDGQSLPTSIPVGTSSTITGELGFSHDGIGEMTNLLCLVVYDSPHCLLLQLLESMLH
ncbi:MAG: hypothetical protein HRO68_01120 [Nitrosopumilus sp.]|nr:hypothetical protein [Nitrosopumilus sp.]